MYFELNLTAQILHFSDSPAEIALAKQQRRSAALGIVRIVRIHSSRYGNKHMNIIHAPGIVLALLALIDEPPIGANQDEIAYSSEIVDLCIFFRAIGRRFPWGLVAFRMFQKMVQQGGYKLPTATVKLFEDFESEEWEKRHKRNFISLYPTPRDNQAQGPSQNDRESMAEFVERLEKLDMRDGAGAVVDGETDAVETRES